MERPAKRRRVPYPDSWSRCKKDVGIYQGLSCLIGNGYGSGDRTISSSTPTPTLTEHDLRRKSPPRMDNPRQWLERPRKNIPVVPRAPDVTIVATAIDVNVQDGSSTLTNTVVLPTTDATIVSFTSIGVVTVTAPSTVSTSQDSSITSTTPISPQSTLNSASASASTTSSPATDSLSSTLTTLISTISQLPSVSNSTITPSSTELTTTVTLTSTLNVSFQNGTAITLAKPTNSVPVDSSVTSHSHRLVTTTTDVTTGTVSGSSFATETFSTSTTTIDSGPQSTATLVVSGDGGSGSAPTSSSASSATSTPSSGGGSGISTTTSQVVGGVVGGVAGLAVVLLIVIAILRMLQRRRRTHNQLPDQLAGRYINHGSRGTSHGMSQQSSRTPLTAAILSSTRRWRPHSSATTATAVTTGTLPESERGFQRIAGRKIAPVLISGSDQYGGNYGAFEDKGEGFSNVDASTRSHPREIPTPTTAQDLADTSFYRDSRGFYSSKEGAPPLTPTFTASSTGHTRWSNSVRDVSHVGSVYEDFHEAAPEGSAVMRPSPARTFVTTSPSVSSIKLPIQQHPTLDPDAPPTPALPQHMAARRQDGIGRSLAAQDGSRGSKFTESV